MAFCEPAEVIRVTRVTPSMIRVRLRAIGSWSWFADGRGDERVDLAFPSPGETCANVSFFNDEHAGRPTYVPEPPWRHYTIRSVHDRGRKFEVDFVAHEGGIASKWAESARPGHMLGVFRGSKVSRPHHVPPLDTRWQLLVADATGFPGLGRIVEELPDGAVVHAIVEIPTAEDRQHIETRARVDWTWLVGPGGLDSQLPAAVERIDLPDGPGYVWVACEAAAARRIRSHLRKVRHQPRERHRAIGFWTAGRVGHDGRDVE